MSNYGREQSPILVGLEEATNKLAETLHALSTPRTGKKQQSEDLQSSAINLIIGFTKTGKTTLLTWLEAQATKQNICVLRRPSARDHRFDCSFGDVLATDLDPKTLQSIANGLVAKKSKGDIDDKMKEGLSYERAVRNIVAEQPLLLLLDETQLYSPAEIAILIRKSREIIDEGKPLAVVLAGMPTLNALCSEDKSVSIARSEKIFLNTLSDAATQKVLALHFKRKGVVIPAGMLGDIARQTDYYPYFIGEMANAICERLEESGATELDDKTLALAANTAKARRMFLYVIPYLSMKNAGLLEHARQTLELIEDNGGYMSVEHLVNSLANRPIGGNAEKAQAICKVMSEHGVIWTVDGKSKSCIPSLYNYLKSKNFK